MSIKIEELAKKGDPRRFKFPMPLLNGRTTHAKMDFSFSGLKTAVRQTIQSFEILDNSTKADIAASFQYTVEQILANRCQHALAYCKAQELPISNLVIAGGVAANQKIFKSLEKIAHDFSVQMIAPPVKLCTDNAAMVAWAGIEKLSLGLQNSLDFEPRPRWPLEQI